MATSVETSKSDLLRKAWERFLSSSDGDALLAFIQAHPELLQDCGHAYPYQHRIADVQVGAQALRVQRCTYCGERLTVRTIPPAKARPQEPGVPYALRGQKLQRWVSQEATHPAKGPIDWTPWLADDPDQPAGVPSLDDSTNSRAQQVLDFVFGTQPPSSEGPDDHAPTG